MRVADSNGYRQQSLRTVFDAARENHDDCRARILCNVRHPRRIKKFDRPSKVQFILLHGVSYATNKHRSHTFKPTAPPYTVYNIGYVLLCTGDEARETKGHQSCYRIPSKADDADADADDDDGGGGGGGCSRRGHGPVVSGILMSSCGS